MPITLNSIIIPNILPCQFLEHYAMSSAYLNRLLHFYQKLLCVLSLKKTVSLGHTCQQIPICCIFIWIMSLYADTFLAVGNIVPDM